MEASITRLRLLDSHAAARELDLASELFHQINRVIPPDQSVLTVSQRCTVRDAVTLMRQHGYSQLPVVDEDEVLGVFSYRSFSQEAARGTLEDWQKQKCSPGDLPVDEFLEPFEFARVTEEMTRAFTALARDGAVLVGTPENLLGILTPMDFVRYLNQVAHPYVMVSEIELALRALIRTALNDDELAVAAKRSLKSIYGSEEKVPTTLEAMTFDNYQSLICFGDNWSAFELVFGGTRSRTSGKLKEVGAIRNDLFHFKREITIDDHEKLADHRNWLLAKVKQAQGHPRPEAAK